MNNRPSPSWFVGLIGLSYPEWSSTLYAGMAPSRASGPQRLRRYATHFNTVEINTTFYGVPALDTVRSWGGATPDTFRFCAKMPRDVTHGPTPPGSLAAPDGPPPGHLLHGGTLDTAHRLIDALRPLGAKLGAILLQFPPRFGPSRRDELAEFLDRLGPTPPLALELRHDDWWTTDTAELLRARAICWAASDESARHHAEHAPGASGPSVPRALTATNDTLYIRWLGKHGQFTDRTHEHFDPTPRLRWWADRLRDVLDQHPRIRTIYALFDNDFAGHAPATARRFMDLVGAAPPSPDAVGPQEPTLFG